MPEIKQTSIASQLMRVVFTLYCFVALLVTAVHIIEEYRHTQASIQEELKSCEKIFGQVLGKAVWDLDREHIQDTLSSILELPVVVGAKIDNTAGKLIDSKGELSSTEGASSASSSEGSNLFQYQFPIHYEFSNKPIKMGLVTVYSNREIVLNRVEVGFTFLVVNAIIKGIALWVIFLWISKYILSRPLQKLTKAVDNIRFETIEPFNPNINTKKNNELDRLTHSFANMVDELIKSKDSVINFNRQLENQVEKRTQDLLESKQIAEDALKIKSDFLATMSHEIRTPMNGVIGMLNLLDKTDLNDNQKKYVNLAHVSADGLLVIINDILDLSKIEAGKVELEEIEFDITSLLTGVANILMNKAEKKGVELILDTENVEHSMVIGDPNRIRQILINLTDNAIKFTPRGRVIIRGECKLSNGQCDLAITLKDSGIGIPEDKLHRLFQNFSQVDSSTTRNFGGTGLGLSISKHLAQLMKGDIAVTSQPDVGSEFVLSIPMKKAQLGDEYLTSPELNDQNVMIIMKDDYQADLCSSLLNDWGANVVHRNSITEAHDTLNKTDHEYSILISDHIDTLEETNNVITNVQRHNSSKTLDLLLITSINEDLDQNALQTLKGAHILTKPFSHVDFTQAILKLHEDVSDVQLDTTIQAENEPVDLSDLHVLLVEDNYINQQVVLGMLEDLSISVDIANNGDEAIKMLSKSDLNQPYDIILMDCQMPVMDGYTASKIIRKGENQLTRYSKTPIIAMTANTLEGDRDKCLAAGMTDYLPKPLMAEDMLMKIKKYSTTH